MLHINIDPLQSKYSQVGGSVSHRAYGDPGDRSPSGLHPAPIEGPGLEPAKRERPTGEREPGGSPSGAQRPSLDTSIHLLCNSSESQEKQQQIRGSAGDDSPVPLPDVGEVLPGGVDWELALIMKPRGAYEMTQEEYREWLAATYAQAACWSARKYGNDHKLTQQLRKKAATVPECGHSWTVPTCDHCGYENGKKAYILDPCGSTGCPICGRTRAQPWRAAVFHYLDDHPVVRVKDKISRLYHSDTYTVYVGETFSVEGFKHDFGKLRSGVKNVWNKVARFLPRPKNGQYGKYPGKCDDAGMIMGIEVGPSANIHAHVLRYGAAHHYEDIRIAYTEKVPHAKVIEHKPIYEKGSELAGAVAEVVKYSVQGTAKKKGKFTHPLVVVMSEIALASRRRTDCYGSMRGMKKRADEHRKKKQAEAEIEGTFEDEVCPHCGGKTWTLTPIKRDHYWVPDGWAKKKKPPS